MLALVLCLAQQVSAAPAREAYLPLVVHLRTEESTVDVGEVAVAIALRGANEPQVPASELAGALVHVVPGVPFHTTLAIPDDVARPVSVWVQVAEPGFQQQRSVLTWKGETKELGCSVCLQPGGSLFGTVRSPRDPEGGCVRMLGPGEAPSACVASGGRFALHFAKGGRCDLAAFVPGGRALVRGLELDPFAAPRVVELEAQPGSTITGRVLDPDGVPIRPYQVAAVPVGFERVDGDPKFLWARLFGGVVPVDEEGRFELRDLSPGEHVLLGRFDGAPERLGIGTVPAGASGVTLTAFVHRIAVTVLDAEGRVLDPSATPGPGSSKPILRFERLDDRVPRRVVEARTAVRVEPGSHWRISRVALDTAPVEIECTVPVEPWLVRRTLQLAAPVEPARLRLDLRAHGRPYRGRFGIEARTASGLDAIVASHPRPGRPIELAPGTYRIQVHPYEEGDCGPIDPRERVPPLGPVAFEVELGPGELVERALDLPLNAQLAIDLALPPQGDAASLAGALHDRELHEGLGVVRVTLRALDSALVLEPAFAVDLCGDRPSELGTCVRLAGLAPGRPNVSVSGIAPGRYAVLVDLADGRRLEREVELSSARLTVVTLP